MNTITFDYGKRFVGVRLDGKIVGHIKPLGEGFAYFPKGVTPGVHGEVFKSIRDCQASLYTTH
jgi:hypothetical protein